MDRKKWLLIGIALAVCVGVAICAVYAVKINDAGGEKETPSTMSAEPTSARFGERPNGDWPGEFGERPTGDWPDGMPPGGERPDMGNMPDREIMQQAMQILEAANFEFTDEVKTSLRALGMTEEQIDMLANMPNRGGPRGGNMP
jgi:hypothetical protein